MGIRPEKIGYQTVRTGNAKHKPTTPEQRAGAKKYGLAHGFYGSLGGWVHDPTGQHVAHGWGQFWHLYKPFIVQWQKSDSGRSRKKNKVAG